MVVVQKANKSKIKVILKQENDYIIDLLTNLNVPDYVEQINLDEYLLDGKKRQQPDKSTSSVNELEERLNTIKNKMKTKRRPISERSLKKREAKKLKKNKEYKKVVQSAYNAIQNNKNKPGTSDDVKDVKNIPKMNPKPLFNTEGKIVFSKFDFAAHPGAKVKSSKKEKGLTNPREALKDIKKLNDKMQELTNKGEEEKVIELTTDIAWKKAFDKISGKKVKDDPKLLYKAIKRKKDEKKKSKQRWVERKKKVEQTIQNKQKKRTENINKKLKTKKNNVLKKLSKKGRIIPGF